MKLVIWQRNLDHLQLHTWKAIQALLEQQITFVITEPENKSRKQQGWLEVDLNALNVIVLKRKGWLKQSVNIIQQNREAIHVFIGFWNDKRLFLLLAYALNHKVKSTVISEHYSTSPVGYMEDEKYIIAKTKVVLRPLLYRFTALLLKANSGNNKEVCIFSISSQARDQYIRAGFNKNTIFLYGYFVPKMVLPANKYIRKMCIRLVFVGVLIKRKGLDIAVNTLQRINQRGIKITLDVYGSGDPTKFIPRDSVAVIYKGVIPTEKAQEVIAQYDALILPSRHDGWGVVVNEAILQGIPVIISDHVGAKCLIEPNGVGLIFESENANDLENCLITLLESPSLLGNLHTNAENIYKNILPGVAAQYFVDALSFYFYGVGSRPDAIWCNKTN